MTAERRSPNPIKIAAATPRFYKAGNGVVAFGDIHPVFWGTEWNGLIEGSERSRIIANLRTVSTTPYYDGLRQYGVIGAPLINEPIHFDDDSFLRLTRETTEDRRDACAAALGVMRRARMIADQHLTPDRMYAFVLPRSVAHPGNIHAFNTAAVLRELDDTENDSYPFIVVYTDQFTLDEISRAFTHEIVELQTDRQPGAGWIRDVEERQIADVDPFVCAAVDDVVAAAYWSIADQCLIVPQKKYGLTVATELVEDEVVDYERGHGSVTFPCGRKLRSGDYDYLVESRRQRHRISWMALGYKPDHIVSVGLMVEGDAKEISFGQHEWPILFVELTLPAPTLTGEASQSIEGAVALAVSRSATGLEIETRSHRGHYQLQIAVTVREAWDVARSLRGFVSGTTVNTRIVTVDLVDKDLLWSSDLTSDLDECDDKSLQLSLREIEQLAKRIPDKGDPAPPVLDELASLIDGLAPAARRRLNRLDAPPAASS